MSCYPFGPGHAAASTLRADFRGPVHLPGDDAYDAARTTWAGGIEQLPGVVTEPLDPGDVRTAVLAARSHDMRLAVQGTGHGTYVPCQGGLLLRTGRMDGVAVDPERRTARVGAGARWSQVIAAAAPFGLAPPSGSHAAVGVAGYTLGGGVGWLSRTHGFAADNLLMAQLVTADGRLMIATAQHDPDLFWALRGAGRNFGVVTTLEIRLAPVASVYAGTVVFPATRAHELLAAFRELAPRHPNELTVRVVLSRRGPGGKPVIGLRSVYVGDAEAGRRALRPLLKVAGTPLAQSFRQMAYADTEQLGSTAPHQFELFADLPEHLTRAAVGVITHPNSEVDEIEVRHWGGATVCATNPGPVGHRDVPFSMTITGARLATGSLAAHATGGSFLNFLHDPSRTAQAYSAADLTRLRKLKRRYDPDNVFGHTHNIAPRPIQAKTARTLSSPMSPNRG
ncbi:MAG: FAD-binding oxidoreductase [Solirubrobacteraceae bacterium]